VYYLIRPIAPQAQAQAQALLEVVVARVISVARIALIHKEATRRIRIRIRVRLIIRGRDIDITRCPVPQ
jgi:hypothetical protein